MASVSRLRRKSEFWVGVWTFMCGLIPWLVDAMPWWDVDPEWWVTLFLMVVGGVWIWSAKRAVDDEHYWKKRYGV